MKYLGLADADKARRLFAAAVKFDPSNGYYHLLLGVTFHLQFRAGGSPEVRDEALAGYEIAARYLPLDPRPHLQLGRLYLDDRDYPKAARAFATGLERRPRDPELLYGLGVASFLNGDIRTALWTAQELSDIGWNPPVVDRMRAVLFAASNDRGLSARYRGAYAKSLEGDGRELGELDARLSEIGQLYDAQTWLRPADAGSRSRGSAGELERLPVAFTSLASTDALADADGQAGGPATVSSAGGVAPPVPPSGPPPISPPPEPPPARLPPAPRPPEAAQSPPAVDSGVGVKPWFLCANGATPTGQQGIGGPMPGGMPGGGGGFPGSMSGADETQQLTALPAPCLGAPAPRMAVIDAVLLRTEDEVVHSFGLNLLQGLNGFFGFVETRTGSSLNVINRSASYGLGVNSNTSLQYSLNIANATDNRNEVLARPTLIAIDRVPSTFFSGSTISIAVGGGAPGSVAQLVDKQVGVSFSITPTFIDDGHVLLSVKAARSFVEPPANGTTGVALSTSRNSVSASLVAGFGDTVILSGLTERELVRGRSGVPVLKDIPGVQYMFGSDNSTDFFRTVVIMITLRKPVTGPADVAAVRQEQEARKIAGVPQRKTYAFYWRIEEFEKTLSKYAPNLDTALDTLESNILYRNFKSTDLKDVDWATVPKLSSMAHDMSLLLYH